MVSTFFYYWIAISYRACFWVPSRDKYNRNKKHALLWSARRSRCKILYDSLINRHRHVYHHNLKALRLLVLGMILKLQHIFSRNYFKIESFYIYLLSNFQQWNHNYNFKFKKVKMINFISGYYFLFVVF